MKALIDDIELNIRQTVERVNMDIKNKTVESAAKELFAVARKAKRVPQLRKYFQEISGRNGAGNLQRL